MSPGSPALYRYDRILSCVPVVSRRVYPIKFSLFLWKEGISVWVKTVELGLGDHIPYEPAYQQLRSQAHPRVMVSTGDVLVSSKQA
ncbi:hypothetical protein TNCV_913291 [Trichonephila clavipes]|nr:hypothetical protein TNCV_913291 [Trichonephila clavipes]